MMQKPHRTCPTYHPGSTAEAVENEPDWSNVPRHRVGFRGEENGRVSGLTHHESDYGDLDEDSDVEFIENAREEYEKLREKATKGELLSVVDFMKHQQVGGLLVECLVRLAFLMSVAYLVSRTITCVCRQNTRLAGDMCSIRRKTSSSMSRIGPQISNGGRKKGSSKAKRLRKVRSRKSTNGGESVARLARTTRRMRPTRTSRKERNENCVKNIPLKKLRF